MGAGTATRNRDKTRNAILGATSQLIAEKGVDGFSMSEVAQRGKINRALIDHYFRTRDNLVFETIRFIVQRYEAMNEASGADPLERSIRMHIEHPEISRFLFHLMPNGQLMPRLSSRLLDAINRLADLKERTGGKFPADPEFAVISGWLIQISRSFARTEIARQFGMSVEGADERMIAQLRSSASLLSSSLSSSSEKALISVPGTL